MICRVSESYVRLFVSPVCYLFVMRYWVCVDVYMVYVYVCVYGCVCVWMCVCMY